MTSRRRPPRSKASDDLTIHIGGYRFDPVEQPVKRRRRAGGREPAVPPAVPLDAEDEGRTGGRPDDTTGRRADEMPGGPPDTRIVQFTRALMDQDIERLRSRYGLALTAYVPNFAYVEQPPENVRRRLQRDPLVRAIVPYLPEFKIAPSIGDPQRSRPEGIAPNEEQLDASLFDRGSTERVVATLEAAGARDVVVMDDRAIGGNARVRFVVPADASLDPVAELDDVRWIEPTPRAKPDNVSAASVIQSGETDEASIWDKGIHGEGQVIDVVDIGPLDIAHCFFADAAPNTPGPAHRKVIAIRNSTGSAAGDHATFVAGCAAGDDRSNPGSHGQRGGAWAAKLVSSNQRDLSTSSLLALLTAAMNSGAFIHTNSWHDDTAGNGSPALYNQNAADVDTFTFNNEDHLVLGSAGNTGEEQGPPGTAKNALCIAAAQSGDNPSSIGDGNPGPTADGRRKPDIVTVGCDIHSALVNTACTVDEWAPGTCATSFATPHAAAAAALIRQYLTEGYYPTGEKTAANAMTPTGALLKAILINATVDMSGAAGYPNDNEGWGLVRLNRALFFPGGRHRMTLWDVRHAVGPTNRELRTHTVQVTDDTEQLKITMAWSDPPPAAGSFATPMVNDMDLRVIAPDGTRYIGNDFANGASRPNSAAVGDSFNTVETVLVSSPAVGTWTIEVQAFRVAVGNPGQGYGLVATAVTKSGCLVAGAVYGNPDHPDVDALRAWRDRWLERGPLAGRAAMRALVRSYRVVGPPVSRLVTGRDRSRALLRRFAFGPVASRVRLPPPSGSD